MKKDIEYLFENTRSNYNRLILDFNLNNFDDSNMIRVNIEIKHILEDLRSVYDYIAIDINNAYCHRSGKIYFQYAAENTNEIEFTKKLLDYFPNTPSGMINLMIDIQHFKSKKKWLINLMDLTNNVKHIELSINKIKIEKRTTYTDGETSMITTGNIKMAPYGNGYGIFGSGAIYASGSGHVSFYGNGIVRVGNGTIDVNDPSKTNLNITYEERNILQFKLIGKDVCEVLTEIIDETQSFLIKLKNQI